MKFLNSGKSRRINGTMHFAPETIKIGTKAEKMTHTKCYP